MIIVHSQHMNRRRQVYTGQSKNPVTTGVQRNDMSENDELL